MSKKRNSKKQSSNGVIAAVIAVILLIGGAVYSYLERPEWFEWLNDGNRGFGWLNERHIADGTLTVTFIDIGQGDCVFIHSNGKTMLIDSGDRGRGDTVVQHIRSLGFTHIDYLVATHPHADHIGGMVPVIRQLSIGEILMPDRQHNTQTFENMLDAIIEKDLYVRTPQIGERFELGGAEVTFLSDGSLVNNNSLNDDSLILIVRFGEHSFLFTGDAEHPSEGALLESGASVSATVLDVGHHGSSTSTGDEFLRRVSPEIAVIQVGEGNIHGHPTAATMNRLETAGVRVYRTDLHGTITIRTDGTDLTVTTEKRSDSPEIRY